MTIQRNMQPKSGLIFLLSSNGM